MSTLVESKRGEVFADSALIAKKFGMRHNKLLLVIANVFIDYPDLREISNLPQTIEKYFTETRIYHGQQYIAYMMNRSFFSLVAMRLTTKPAREWQRKFNTAFYQLENQLQLAKNNLHDHQWVLQRSQTKLLRKVETDAIEQFIAYATSQGSQHANNYYINFTNVTYRALGFVKYRQPNLRDTLNAMQLSWLVTLESLLQVSLQKYMNNGLPYKEIYKLVARDLTQYAEPLLLLKAA